MFNKKSKKGYTSEPGLLMKDKLYRKYKYCVVTYNSVLSVVYWVLLDVMLEIISRQRP